MEHPQRKDDCMQLAHGMCNDKDIQAMGQNTVASIREYPSGKKEVKKKGISPAEERGR